MHHGLLPRDPGRRAGRRPRTGDRQSEGGACTRARHGLPALHAGAGNDGRRKPGAGARRRAGRGGLGEGEEATRGVPVADAVQGAAGCQSLRHFRRRAPEMRDSKAALSEAALSHPRRADLRSDAGRGRRGAGHAARHGRGGRSHHPDDHAQIPRGDGVCRRGDDPAPRQAGRAWQGRRTHAGRYGPHHDRRRAVDGPAATGWRGRRSQDWS